jgi:ribonuclease-3
MSENGAFSRGWTAQYCFRDPALLEAALTHPSALNQIGGPEGAQDVKARDYERLEFLGDRVLGLLIADMIFRRFPTEREGALALRHSALVRRETLSQVALEMGLQSQIRLAAGEEAAGERDNPAILANVCEAVIAALYLDAGLEAVRGLVDRYWSARLEKAVRPPRDPKTALQEWAQGRGLPLPVYRETGREGPPHEPYFTVQAEIEGRSATSASGRSKRAAEQAAARKLLQDLAPEEL